MRLNPTTDDERYLVDQGHAIGEAVRAAVKTGDVTPVLKLASHTVAEGDLPVDIVVAAMLVRVAEEHLARGEKKEAEHAVALMRLACSDEAIRTAQAAAVTRVGMEQGWLPADKYDQLAEFAAGIKDGMMREALDQIERRA